MNAIQYVTHTRKPLGVAVLVLAALVPHSTVFAQRLEFEVASVKPNTDNKTINFRGALGPDRSGDLIRFHNTQLYSIVFYAYHLSGNYQTVGFVPFSEQRWNWYDIEARTGANATDDQIRLMTQSLLEDRFQLKAHRETRDLPKYELTIAKGKPKLAPAREGQMTVTIEGRTLPTPSGGCSITLWTEGNHLICHAVGMDRIVSQLVSALQAPVADHTGLTGTYDVNVLISAG